MVSQYTYVGTTNNKALKVTRAHSLISILHPLLPLSFCVPYLAPSTFMY